MTKLNIDKDELKKITEKIDDTSKRVDSIMHNRLIIAIFMIVDGINFIINPVNSMEFMARMVAAFALFAASAVLITNIKSKSKNKKSMILAIAMILVCIYILIFPRLMGKNIRILLAIFIILNGLINIFNTLQLDKISQFMTDAANRLKSRFDPENNNDNEKNIMLEQTSKVIDPLNNFIEKSNKKSNLYLIANVISILLGLALFTVHSGALVICGVILIYTGICDFFMYAKTTELSKKFRVNKKA